MGDRGKGRGGEDLVEELACLGIGQNCAFGEFWQKFMDVAVYVFGRDFMLLCVRKCRDW